MFCSSCFSAPFGTYNLSGSHGFHSDPELIVNYPVLYSTVLTVQYCVLRYVIIRI